MERLTIGAIFLALASVPPATVTAQDGAWSDAPDACGPAVQRARELGESLGAMRRQLADKAEMSKVLVDISQTGLAGGLEFELFQPGPSSTGEFFSEYPVSIKVRGRYLELGYFVKGVLSLPRLVAIRDFTIQLDTETASRSPRQSCQRPLPLQMEVLLVIYGSERSAPDRGGEADLFLKGRCTPARLAQIKDLDAELRREMSAVLAIAASRYDTLHALDVFVRATPQTVGLKKITRTGETLGVKGRAETEAAMTTYIRNLVASDSFDRVSSSGGSNDFLITPTRPSRNQTGLSIYGYG